MCRPARMTRGRSSRSSIQCVSTGTPASRSSSAPASRSASACASVRRLVDPAVLVQPDVAVRVDQAGHAASRGRRGSRRRRRARRVTRPSSSTHRSRCSPSGRTTPAGAAAPVAPPGRTGQLRTPVPARAGSTRCQLGSGGRRSSARRAARSPRAGRAPSPDSRASPLPLLERPLGRVAGPAALGLLRRAPPCPWPSCRGPCPACPGMPRHPGHAAAGRELAHHLLRLGEPLDQAVDVGRPRGRSRGRCAAGASR